MQEAQIHSFRPTFKQPIETQHCVMPHTLVSGLIIVRVSQREIWMCC